MDGGSIVLNSISCKGLKCFTLFQKPSVYAVISITGGGDCRHPKREKHKTPADNEGGENPEWDQKIQLYLDHSDLKDLFLEFRIKAQGNLLLGDKLVGKSRVLMADLTEGQPSGVVRHVSYQVQSSDGKPNGVLSFSYKMNLPDFEIQLPPPLDPVIPSAQVQDYYPPPSSPNSFKSLPASTPRGSLYPPLPLLDAAPRDIVNHDQAPPPDLANYYAPPPPPWPETLGYYRPSDSAVCLEPGCLPGHASANREYYLPPPAALPPPPPSPTQVPSFGLCYPPPAPYYTYPPPQDSCTYWHCNSYIKKSKYEEELTSRAGSSCETFRRSGIMFNPPPWPMHTEWGPTGGPNLAEMRGPPSHWHV